MNVIQSATAFTLFLFLAFGISFAAYPSGLVSYWTFDSNANDALGLNNGTVSGAILNSTGGKVGGAYDFKVALNNINFNQSSSLDFASGSSFTYLGYFKSSYNATDQRILYKFNATEGSGYAVFLQSNCELWGVTWSAAKSNVTRASGVNYCDGQWHHLAFVRDQQNGLILLYVDGLVRNSTVEPQRSLANSARLGFGIDYGFGSLYFHGSLDEMALFNRSLSASEISQFYNNSKDGVKNYFGDCRHACPTFGSGNLNNSSTIASKSVFANITLNTTTALKNFNFSWNGTNYSIYDDSLVGMWSFENSTNDSSKYGNSGMLVNATYTAGKYGNGLQFNGNNTHVDFGNPATFNFGTTQDFTLSVWFKTNSTPNPSNLISKGTGCWANGYKIEYYNGAMQFWMANGTFNYGIVSVSYSPFDNSWHHIAATVNRTSKNASLYIDGYLRNSVIYPTNFNLSSASQDFVAGYDYGCSIPLNFFNGSLDEIRIYSRSLSAAEVNQLYLSNLKKVNSNSWEFDTNQTNLTDGAYAYAGYATDTQGYTDSTGLRSVTLAYNPVFSTYGGSTTNFAAVSDLTNVTNLTLEKIGKGKIKFPSMHSVNAAGQDYDANVVMGSGFVSVNSSGLDSSFNSTATLAMNLTGIYSGTATPTIYYYEPFTTSAATILQNGAACSAPRCTGISWDQATGMLTFNVSGFSGYAIYDNSTGLQIAYNSSGTLGINITSTNQIAVYTASAKNNSAFSFIPVTPPAAGSITLLSNESSNVTGGDTGFLVENQGNVNVSITVASDKNASLFIGGSTPLFQMFGGANESGACAGTGLNTSAQDLGASAITVCPNLAFPDAYDTIWAFVLVKINSDSPPQANTATLTFTSTQAV